MTDIVIVEKSQDVVIVQPGEQGPMGAAVAVLGGALIAGSVIFAGAGNTIAQDNANFFWDNTNKIITVAGGTYQAPTSGQGKVLANATNGLVLSGFGSTWDVALTNRAGLVAAGVSPNTQTLTAHTLTVSTGNLTVSAGQVLVANGDVGAPSYAFSGATVRGMYSTGADLRFAVSGIFQVGIFDGQVNLPTSVFIGAIGLHNEATNTLAQRNGTNAQLFHVYGIFTNASNYERVRLGFIGSQFQLFTENAGTGVTRPLLLGTLGASDIQLWTDTVQRWNISGSSGHVLAQIDNIYDIGASGATRPRTGYFGTSVVLGRTGTDGQASFLRTSDGAEIGAILHGGSDTFQIRNNAGGGIDLHSAGALQVRIAATGSANRNITLTGSNGGNPTISVSAGNLAITPAVVAASSIQTGAPSGGTAAAWKFGTTSITSPTAPNRTIELDVAGTRYFLHAKTTND